MKDKMRVLPIEKRMQILELLIKGNSMRSIAHVVGCSINTVTKLLYDAGAACAAYQDAAKVRDLKKTQMQCIEYEKIAIRMHMRHLNHLTNGLNKKIENLYNAIALHCMYYNFCKIHKTLRTTPAMEAGISNHVWSIEEIARLIPEPVAVRPIKYKKHQKISN